MSSENNKRVAKNAVALTLRMVLVTIVGLYTSRIVLQALGVDDYGIYGVIGGVVGMASFLNASMAGATSRFITFELGRGDDKKLKSIFSNALIIHIIIAIIVAILAETVGLWFVNNKMNFPPGSMFAVNVLYQFTILSMFVSFTQVPYSAAIIAHEKMNIYAYFEIINVILKLGIVYLLLIVSTNRLILYAGLTLAVSIISAVIYRFYCIRHFKEARFSRIWNKTIMREMLTFSGYDLYGNMCAVMKSQGQPIVLNLFFGVLANAAASIAMTITGAISGLTSGIFQAFKPQIIKYYAADRLDMMEIMIVRSTIFSLSSFAAIAVPFLICTYEVEYLWLGNVPTYSTEFVKLVILASFFNIVINTNNTILHATGDIRLISFINGSIYFLCPIISYLFLKTVHVNIYIVYIINVFCSLLVGALGCVYVHIQVPGLSIFNYIASIIKSLIIVSIVAVICYFSETALLDQRLSAIWRLLIVGIESMILICSLTYIFLLTTSEKDVIKSRLQSSISKIRN